MSRSPLIRFVKTKGDSGGHLTIATPVLGGFVSTSDPPPSTDITPDPQRVYLPLSLGQVDLVLFLERTEEV